MVKNDVMCALVACGIRVPAQHSCALKLFVDRFFQALCAQTVLADVRSFTLRANRGHFAAVIADVTDQGILVLMEGQLRVTAGAAQHIAAVAAEHIGCRSAAVKEKDRLFPFGQHVIDRRMQYTAEHRAVAGLQFLAHVHDLHFWQRQCARRFCRSIGGLLVCQYAVGQ